MSFPFYSLDVLYVGFRYRFLFINEWKYQVSHIDVIVQIPPILVFRPYVRTFMVFLHILLPGIITKKVFAASTYTWTPRQANLRLVRHKVHVWIKSLFYWITICVWNRIAFHIYAPCQQFVQISVGTHIRLVLRIFCQKIPAGRTQPSESNANDDIYFFHNSHN